MDILFCLGRILTDFRHLFNPVRLQKENFALGAFMVNSKNQ